jgi:hypothetical protein
VAGTGTIDPEGVVGPIGGITQKLKGAQRAGATLFLAPKDNCDEVAGNEPAGLTVNYFLKAAATGKVAVRITNAAGDVIAALDGGTAAGLNSVVWDFRRTGSQPPSQAAGAQGPRAMAALAPPGEYVVVLDVGDKTWRTRAVVRAAPGRN